MLGAGVGVCDSARQRHAAGGGGDTTAPAQVTDLAATGPPSPDDVVLGWTAAGDDGMSGTAAFWAMRRAPSVITSEAAWDAAADALGGGWNANFVAGGNPADYLLSADVGTEYFVVRYKDEAGNVGPISNNAVVIWPL